MKTIYKYRIPSNGTINASQDALILHAGEQDESLFVWMLVETEEKNHVYNIAIISTGSAINRLLKFEFINTVQMKNGLVFHIFENLGL